MKIKIIDSLDKYSEQLMNLLPEDNKFEIKWKNIPINHSDKYNLEKEIDNEIKGKSGVYVYSLNEIPLYVGEGNLIKRIQDHWNEAQFPRDDYSNLFGNKKDLLETKIIDARNRVQSIGCSINDVRFFSHEKFIKHLDIHYLVISVKNDRKNISKCFESFLTLHLKPVYERMKSKTGGLWVKYDLYNNALNNSYNEALLEFISKI